MNEKQTELLRLLIQSNTPIKGGNLAEILHISPRSVKNYVKEINSLYKNKLILSSRNGYELNRTVPFTIPEYGENQIPQSTEDRIFFILKKLILSHVSRLDIFELCDYLCVSYSTIRTLISTMNKMFASYNVKFTSEKECLEIIGDEKSIRRLINYVINEESKASFIDMEQLQKCFPDMNVALVRATLINTAKKHSLYLSDFAIANMLLHILILIDREMHGYRLETDFADLKMAGKAEYEMSEDLYHQLEKQLNIHLNKSIQPEFYTLIRANASYSRVAATKDPENIIGNDILEFIDDEVKNIRNLYMIDLDTPSFVTAFSLHLKSLLFRAKRQSWFANPLTDSIRLNNPIVYDIAIYMSLAIMEHFACTINEDEMALVAIHIGGELERQNADRDKVPVLLLCPDYLNMQDAILNKLMLNFGNQIDIVGCINSEEELDGFGNPVLLTTIPLKNTYSFTNVIQLSSLDISKQYPQIQDELAKRWTWHKNHVLKKYFDNYFEEDLFLANPDTTDGKQLLSDLCELLYQKGYVSENYYENVLRREQAASTAFGHIAIPHSVVMDAFKTCVTVAISQRGFHWGESNIHIILLIAINRADRKIFRELYESIINLFEEEDMIQRARGCTTFKEFKDFIQTYAHALE